MHTRNTLIHTKTSHLQVSNCLAFDQLSQTAHTFQSFSEPVAETEEQQLLSSDNYANSDAHTALPEEEGQEHQQPEEEYQELDLKSFMGSIGRQ